MSAKMKKKRRKKRTFDSFSPPEIVSEISALGFLLLRNIYSFLFFSKHRSFSLSLDIGGSCLRPFQDVKEPFQGFVSHIRCISS